MMVLRAELELLALSLLLLAPAFLLLALTSPFTDETLKVGGNPIFYVLLFFFLGIATLSLAFLLAQKIFS